MPKKWIYSLLILIVFCLFIIANVFYVGSPSIYILFSLSAFSMLAVCFIQKCFVGPLFLGLFLFLGLWFKATLYFVTHKNFIEPIGRFNFSSQSWDEVLTVSTVGLFGFTLILILFMWYDKKKNQKIVQVYVPGFFCKNRHFVYGITVVLALAFSILNMKLGIHQIGLRPQTVLPWPLNGLIAFLINFGFTILLSIYLYWDLQMEKSSRLGLALIAFTAALLSVSVLSRGMFFIQFIPFFFVFLIYQKIIKNEAIYLLGLFVVFLVLTVAGTSALRLRVYPKVGSITTPAQEMLTRLQVLDGGIERVKSLIEQGEDHRAHLVDIENERRLLLEKLGRGQLGDQTAAKPLNQSALSKPVSSFISQKVATPFAAAEIATSPLMNIVSLALTRFVGIEGIMAMQSYSDKDQELFYRALVEKRNMNSPTLYQDVAQSTYRYSDMNVWQFATLPGIIAFLYYSGSVLFVFLGMAVVGALLLFLEVVLARVTGHNFILVSVVMVSISSTVAQFGVTPRQDLLYYSMVVGFIVVCYIIIKFFKTEEDIKC